jgi:hydroxymethylbilane synthase
MAHLRIGSRGSQLALWQANHISALLRDRGHQVELEIIKTTGDKITDVALAKVGTKGMFTKEIEEALAEGRVDLAVHSLKDLPTELSPGFEIAAITKRENPRDVFCSRKYAGIDDLPRGAAVGTSSLRRQAQLKAVRPDLQIFPLRGNVDTRLRKLAEGEVDALVLAAAGLHRLGRDREAGGALEQLVPAAGQGALALEARPGAVDPGQLTALSVPDAAACVSAERELVHALGASCHTPVGAHARVLEGGELELVAWVGLPDGSEWLSDRLRGVADGLGEAVAKRMLSAGAGELLARAAREVPL